MIRYSHGQTAFCSYVLDQMALHVYLQKVICGTNETSLVHVPFLSGIGSGSIAILSTKTSIPCIFYSCLNFIWKKGRGNFWRPQFALWRPKIYTWSPVGARIKKLISDPVMLITKFRLTDCVQILQSFGSICGKLLRPGTNVTFH